MVFATGVIAAGEDDLERFRSRAEELAASLDLAEVWEVVNGEDDPLPLDDVAELHWGAPPSGEQLAAMLLHLNRSSLYFVAGDGGFRPRPQQAVEETLARQRRAAENALATEELAQHLAGRHPARGTLGVPGRAALAPARLRRPRRKLHPRLGSGLPAAARRPRRPRPATAELRHPRARGSAVAGRAAGARARRHPRAYSPGRPGRGGRAGRVRHSAPAAPPRPDLRARHHHRRRLDAR